MLKTVHRRSVRRLITALAAVSGLALTVLSPLATATADAGPNRSPAPAVSTNVTTVPPMGAKAAALTAKARGGKARSAPPAKSEQLRSSAVNRTTAAREFWELQLNLCNSGHADACFSGGQALYEGGDVIYYAAPDVVTLNEICRSDIPNYLHPSLAEAWPGDWTYYAFYPAFQSNGAPITCTGGRGDYGNAVIGRVPAALWQGVTAWSGDYTAQDDSGERRTFVCAYAVGDHMGCATHLAARSEPIAMNQCRALMFDALPYIRAQEGLSLKTVVGGDLNMEYDTADPENVQNCVPNGHTRKGDDGVQHVIFTNDFGFIGTLRFAMAHSDKDGHLVRLTKP